MAHTPNTNRSDARCSRRDQRTIPITSRFIDMSNHGRGSGLIFSARRARRTILAFAAFIVLAAAPRIGWGQGSCPTLPAPDCNMWHGPITLTVSMAGEGASALGSSDGLPPYGNPFDVTVYTIVLSISTTLAPTPPYTFHCCLSITFCYECCNGVLETYLEQVTPLSAPCDGITPQDMISWASN